MKKLLLSLFILGATFIVGCGSKTQISYYYIVDDKPLHCILLERDHNFYTIKYYDGIWKYKTRVSKYDIIEVIKKEE